jgi:tetratricopeptide (TPR) repeat protein
MSKSKVEVHEQIAAQDPSSTDFIALAKTLIDQGNHLPAIDVCRTGLEHHPNSILGRVLWGRALIHLGRPAEAMEQFDRAIDLGRENPHTYGLISEVLLQRGLYRSALPLLKKAVLLQPSNGRWRQWFEETQRALAGGAPPTIGSELNWPPEDPIPAQATPPPNAAQGSGHLPEAHSPAKQRLSVLADPEDTPPMFHASPPTARISDRPGAEVHEAPLPGHPDPAEEALPPAPAEIRGEAEQLAGLNGPEADAPRSLLDEVVEVPEGHTAVARPRAEVSSLEAQEIARQYERELRQKLVEKGEEAKRSFLARHAIKIASATVLGVALLVGLGFYLSTRAVNQGRDLKDDLAQARKAIAQDTRKSYLFALDRLSHALKMDEDSQEAWALTALTRSILFAEQGGSSEDRAAGRAALGRPQIRERFPAHALAADFYLSDFAQKQQLAKNVLDSTVDAPEIHELAGRILLARKDSTAAVEKFRRAMTLSPTSVRALVALGDYYRESGDYLSGLKFYGAAGQISPAHPGVVLGAAECRLELSIDLEEALKNLEGLPKDEVLPPDQLVRKELALGRLLIARGSYDEAIKKLSDGAGRFKVRSFDFQLALGDASRASGRIDAAQQAYEAALTLRPHSEEAKEAVGRALIARDRQRELFNRFPADANARPVALIRGIAFAKLGDWKRARAELGRTQVNGKFPSEAVIYLALADAADGQPERAQSVLEKLLASSRKAKSDVRVALGSVYWQRGLLDKARSQFEEASKDPEDFEGACSLGRFLLSLGNAEAAIDPLSKSLARNGFHGEARRAVAQVYLQLGRLPEAVAQLEAWRTQQPSSAAPHKLLSLSLFRAGKLREAEAAIARAISLDSRDPESHRIRSQILFARGDGRSAFAELQKASKAGPASEETSCELGAAYMRQSLPDAAAKEYEAARRQNQESFCGRIGTHYAALPAASKSAARELTDLAQRAPEFWNRSFALSTLALVLVETGSVKEARRAAEQSVSLYPYSGVAHLALGTVLLRQKEEGRAREELAKAVELDPTDSSAHLALADALVRNDQLRVSALEHYQWFLKLGSGGAQQLRVKRMLPNLKKKLALR